MTDTDKLKRLAEELRVPVPIRLRLSQYQANDIASDILAMIAENEALSDYGRDAALEAVQCRKERDEAVALLQECLNQPMEPWGKVSAFLARIDAKGSE